MQQTALYEQHKELGAKLVPFSGWKMPVSYQGVLAEHHIVRKNCGLFDVSHMGELKVEGPDATRFLQKLLINDVDLLKDCQGQYSALLNREGGFIDDLILYRLSQQSYLVCVNAANIEKDSLWIRSLVDSEEGRFEVEVHNESDRWSQIAIQGPSCTEVMEAAGITQASQLDYMSIVKCPEIANGALVARTGYTGEKGYEVYLPNASAPEFWQRLIATQKAAPIGLGARDTLRLEACYLLYGNDMDETVSPLEAGIGWATRLNGADFIGKTALLEQRQKGLKQKTVAFTMADQGIPRHSMTVLKDDEIVGTVTSGSVLPTVGGAGGMARLDAKLATVGSEILIDIRGKRKLARIVSRPLYSPRVK